MTSPSVKRFHDAVQVGDRDIIEAMLAADPSLATSTDKYLFQPVHLLDVGCEEEILDLLLAHGADINARNDEGVTLLHLVTEGDFVPLLLERGADLEARDAQGWTPLIMQASEQDREDVIAALLEAGADVNAAGNDGQTALTFARRFGDDVLTDMLTGAGATR